MEAENHSAIIHRRLMNHREAYQEEGKPKLCTFIPAWNALAESYLFVHPDQMLAFGIEWFAIAYQALFIVLGLIYVIMIALSSTPKPARVATAKSRARR